jgi:hypothetical protein
MHDSHFRTRLDISKIVDTLTLIDMRRWGMSRLLRRSKELAVEFCDRCARVCEARCRKAALRERALLRRPGVGL